MILQLEVDLFLKFSSKLELLIFRNRYLKHIHFQIAYLQLAIDAAVLLGADADQAEKELTEAIQFEINLANVSSRTLKNHLSTSQLFK